MENTMENYTSILRGDEKYVLSLRALYEESGFVRYRMGKFEEYSLYMDYKNFLGRRNIITVTSPSGRLLALKPDITLSIVKNSAKAGATGAVKAYYSENVYVPDPDSDTIKEIPQVGVEYLDPSAGGADFAPAVAEAATLAAKSLELLGHRWVLCLSHMGFIKAVLDEAGLEGEARAKATELIADKNSHGLQALMDGLGRQRAGERLAALAKLAGDYKMVTDAAAELVYSAEAEAALDELRALAETLSGISAENGDIHLDFSIINDVDYYGGAVFKGFVDGVPRAVLTGGRYDRMAEDLGCGGGAVGFCVLVGELERLLGGK